MARQRVARVSSVVVIVLVLVAIPLLASGAPVADSAVLGDIRTTPLLDDFDRANENPLSGGGNWAKADASSQGIQLLNNKVTLAAGGLARYEWTPAAVDGDVEVWARYAGAGMDDGAAAELVIVTDVGGSNQVDGYALRAVNTFGGAGWQIRRLQNWSATVIASAPFGPGGISDAGQLVLFRRSGTALEGWRSLDGGATWAREITVTDATYTANLHVGLGFSIALASSPSWDDFGGGATSSPTSAGPPPGQSNGTCTGSGSLGLTGSRCLSDPVNTRTGAFVDHVGDLATPGTGVSFDWTRTYTSSDGVTGPLGPGWTHAYAASLQVHANGDVLARGAEGQEIVFTRQADGSFAGAPGARATLSSSAVGYDLLRRDQVRYSFDPSGRLLAIVNRNGQGMTLAYDGQGRLTSLRDSAGRRATVAYEPSGRVDSVSTEDGRSVSYGYASGRLASVTDVGGKVWRYTYDAGGRLATVVDPLGHTPVTNAYGADGRVQAQTDALGRTTRFSWDPATEISTVTDPNGGVWRHDYDEGVLARETDALGDATELRHDLDLNMVSVTSPSAERTTMTYDAAGNLLAATAPSSLGSVQKTFVYNGRNDPVQVTDGRGTVTAYTYTPEGDTETVTQDGVRIASYSYDAAGRVLASTDGNGKTTRYTYAPATGYLASVTDPLGNETTYTYDGAGRVAARVDPKGNLPGSSPADFRWSYTYAEAGRQLTESDPLGHVTTKVYDDAGRLVSTTDANGHGTTFGYDDAGRIVTGTGPDPDGGGSLIAPVTRYAYDDVGNVIAQTDPRGSTTRYVYDAANRLVSETGPDPDGPGPLAAPVTTHAYDSDGNLASTVEPRGNVPGADPADFRTSYAYDAAGRLVRTTDPLGHATVSTYDAVGNLVSVRDPAGHVTGYTHDAAGRVLTVTAPDLGVTSYAYDEAGNLLTRRDANGHAMSYRYDDAGQLVAETSPDPDGTGPRAPAVTSHAYDANGNRRTLTDANGNATAAPGDGTTTFGYDRANRLVAIDYADETPDVAFTYDAAGNRLSMSDGSGTESRTYDALDRLLTVSRGQNVFSYAYDAAGNVTRRTQPGGVVAEYAYDALDRLVAVTSGGRQTTYAYDAGSNLVQTALPAQNGHVEIRAYDRAGRLTDVATQKGGAVLARFASTLDAVGNPLSTVRTGSLTETRTYGYDANHRLVSVCFEVGACPGPSDPFVRWTYDQVGNRLSEQRSGSNTGYAYDARDRLLSAGSTTYTYDENGNELSAGSRTFAYDLENRLRSTTQGGTTTTYVYDGDGVRLRASTGAQASRVTGLLWDVNGGLPQIASERDGNGKPLRRYVYGMHRISQTAGNSTSYFAYDGLGSVANLTSATGGMQWTWSYDPFGAIRAETKASGNQPASTMRFAGEYLDPTGLYHLRARQYDPEVGRFLSSDPADGDIGSPLVAAYVYVADRPSVMTDPSGETYESASDASGAAEFSASSVDVDMPLIRCRTVHCGRAPAVPASRVYPIPKRYASRVVPSPGPYGVHPTEGLPGYPAIDFAVEAPASVVAVESGRVRDWSGHSPGLGPIGGIHGPFGWSVYLRGDSGRDYYYTHLGSRAVAPGVRVRVGQRIGRVGNYSRWGGLDHLHLGANVGRTRSNSGADYAKGAALIVAISRAPRP